MQRSIEQINAELAGIAEEMAGRWEQYMGTGQGGDDLVQWIGEQAPRVTSLRIEKVDAKTMKGMRIEEIGARLGWDESELVHAEDALVSNGELEPECVLLLHSGREIRTPAYPEPCSYVRVVQNGFELAYWDIDEIREDPEQVVGAIIGAAKGGVETPDVIDLRVTVKADMQRPEPSAGAETSSPSATEGASDDAEAQAIVVVPQHLSLEEFRGQVELRRLTNHGRAFLAFWNGQSLGFADEGFPAEQVHERQVNNALYRCSLDAPEFLRGALLPSPEALKEYPHLQKKFPREFALATGPLEWTQEHVNAAEREGWAIFRQHGHGELQIQKLDEDAVLEEDAAAWEIVFHGNEAHHVVARAWVAKHSPGEWERICKHVEAMRQGEEKREEGPKC